MPISAEQWRAVTGSLNAGKGSLRPRSSFKPSSPLCDLLHPLSNDWKDYYTAMVLVCTPLLLYRLYLVCVTIMMFLVSRPGANILISSPYTNAELTADVSISFMNHHDGVPWHLLFSTLNVLLYIAMVITVVSFSIKECILRTRKKHDLVLTQQLDHLDLYLLNFGPDCEVIFDPENRNVYATPSTKDIYTEPVLKCVHVTSDSMTMKREKKSDVAGHIIGIVVTFFLQLSPLVVLAMLLLLAGDVERNPGPIHDLTMDDHFKVCQYLIIMDMNQIIQLGGALGLSHHKLSHMKDLPSDMVSAWLRAEDNVLTKSGRPTWNTLVEALKSIGQNGIAITISDDLEQLKDASCPSTQPPLSSGSVSTGTTLTALTPLPQTTVEPRPIVIKGKNLTMDDYFEVCQYLKIMNEKQIIQLGGALGLNHHELQRMKDLPSDIVSAWLRKEDNVLTKSGRPSWNTLVEALKSIGQNGIAGKISHDLKRLKDESSPSTQPPLSSGSVSNPPLKPADEPSTSPDQMATASKEWGPTQQICDILVFKKHCLGSGAFGSVFKGQLMSDGRFCAVKVLNPLGIEIRTSLPASSQTVQDESLERFKRECDFLEKFDHDNVVRHIANRIHPESNLPVLVLELLDCSLTNFLDPKQSTTDLPMKTQVSLCRDIASALVYLHDPQRNIVHRDLCSDNILLRLADPIPVAKVGDFGMSRIIDSTNLSHSLTAMGHRMGYMPSEAHSAEYDSSVDIFMFGVITIQIVRKIHHIRSEKERVEHLQAVAKEHPLYKNIASCLHKNKERRPEACILFQLLCLIFEGCRKPNSGDDCTTAMQQVPPLTAPDLAVCSRFIEGPKRLKPNCQAVTPLPPTTVKPRPIVVQGKSYGKTELGILKKNEDKIKHSFAHLVSQVQTMLTNRPVSIDIDVFRTFMSNLFPGILQHIPSTASISDFFNYISDHQLWSYTNHTPVESVAKEYLSADPRMEELIEKYEIELAGYSATTSLVDYIALCKENDHKPAITLDDDYFEKISLKLEIPFSDETLEYVSTLWKSLARRFLLPTVTALLYRVVEGSLVITWRIPHHFAMKIRESITKDAVVEFLSDKHISEVKLGERVLYDVKLLVTKTYRDVSAMTAYNTGLFKNKEESREYMTSGKDMISILFVGKISTGKSSMVNAFIRLKVAEEGDRVRAVTTRIQAYESKVHVREIGRNVVVKVWDTPGLGDGQASDEEEDRLKTVLAEHIREMDVVFYCLDMRGCLESSNLEDLEAFSKKAGPDLWKHTMFVLTFANQVLPTDRGVDKLKHFQKSMSTWTESLYTALTKKLKISEDIVKQIPIVPTGYRNDPPPDREDWFTPLWTTAYQRTRPRAQPAIFTISVSRIRQGSSSQQPAWVNPEDMEIHLDAQYPVYTLKISFVTGAATVVTTATVGAVIGGLLGGPIGAAVGASAFGATAIAVVYVNSKTVIKSTIDN